MSDPIRFIHFIFVLVRRRNSECVRDVAQMQKKTLLVSILSEDHVRCVVSLAVFNGNAGSA